MLLIGCFTLGLWDYHRVNRDFHTLLALLTEVRLESVRYGKTHVARFAEKSITVTEMTTGAVRTKLPLPTLEEVNYDTSLGPDMIVFTPHGTGDYNLRIHGGDLTMSSWLGFKRHLAVNCTGYVNEGRYPE